MPLVIALTGGIGSGKSTAAAILGELGAAIIDTDAIAHRLTAPGQPGARAIGEQFGAGYLRGDGALDRDRMRQLVFSDPAAKKKLEAILHPMIRAEVNAAVRAAHAPYIVIVVPLLIETGAYRDLAQRILVIDCSEQQQMARVIQRNGFTPEAAQAIMASQVSRAERLGHAHDVVRNETGLTALRADVVALHGRYLELAKQGSSPG
ncbi:MAG: dephospho-CoA kinase [Betaproteobacteria bacterium]|nr:dephospho-CoA kinase [Betaproteobacteria bacterium]MBI2226923.1 dephospho-CoA kinase [Betaproteobacteria bacterium]MBI3056696.1 dephospho-CoA kinase [Betaproteobacteria bacterium]